MTEFVKSAGTSTSAATSRGDLEKILRRYGCSGFGTSADYNDQKIAVSFRVADSKVEGAPQVPVKLEVSIEAVARALGFLETKTRASWQTPRPRKPTQYELEQAERVAWRHLVLWVDAACSAAAAGMQTMSEAFFAHVLTHGPDGKVRRMIDQIEAEAGADWRQRLLPPARS